MLRSLSIATKLSLMTGVTFIALIVSAAIGLYFAQNQMIEDRLSKLRAIVEVATGIAEDLEEQVQAGAITHDDALSQFSTIINGMWFDDEQEYLFVYSYEGVNVVHPARHDLIGQNLMHLQDENGVFVIRDLVDLGRSGGGALYYSWPRSNSDVPERKLAYAGGFDPWNLFIGTGVYVDDVDAAVFDLAIQVLGTIIVLGIIAIGLAIAILTDVAGSMKRLCERMANIAGGQLEIDIPEVKRNDEIGQMADALEVLRRKAADSVTLEQQAADARESAEIEKKQAIEQVSQDFNQMMAGLVQQFSEASISMLDASKTAANAATDANTTSHDVSSWTNIAAENVQTVATAAEELSSTIREVSQQVAQAAQTADEAATKAEKTSATVLEMKQSAEKIGEVVTLIREIAEQTNLLALNATIEAARAGEMGKGFAVVASEVKNLASQTARATDEIAQQIGTMQEVSSEAAQAMEEIRSTNSSMQHISSSIAAAVEEQTAATSEIARNAQEASGGTQQTADSMVKITGATQTSGDCAQELVSLSETVSGLSDTLSNQVKDFVARLGRRSGAATDGA